MQRMRPISQNFREILRIDNCEIRRFCLTFIYKLTHFLSYRALLDSDGFISYQNYPRLTPPPDLLLQDQCQRRESFHHLLCTDQPVDYKVCCMVVGRWGCAHVSCLLSLPITDGKCARMVSMVAELGLPVFFHCGSGLQNTLYISLFLISLHLNYSRHSADCSADT